MRTIDVSKSQTTKIAKGILQDAFGRILSHMSSIERFTVTDDADTLKVDIEFRKVKVDK